MPIGIKWNYNGQEYRIQNGNKIIAKLLKDNKHIAVIEENKKINEAYIINGYNIQEYNIRKLLDKKDLTITSPYITENNIIKLNKETLAFYNVYYEGMELYFFVFIENEYYRFSFDLETGEIGELIISR
ncbi:MAG: hypothetical protein LBI57_05075 [Helicobacteraceae bacterium]|nr:hypothetical protein [Helicobacteraceae bacterium]